MSDNITHVTEASFDQEVLAAEHPVLVDFWAEWCGPCKMIAPILDEIATEYAGQNLKFVKLMSTQTQACPRSSAFEASQH